MKGLITKGYRLLLLISFVFQFSTISGQNEKVIKVADDIYCFLGPQGYNTLFLVTDKGIVAIDPINPNHAEGFLKSIRETSTKPLKYLLYSHNHWDHACGGEIFEKEGIRSLIHYEAMEWMKENPHKDLRIPDKSWVGSLKKMNFGNIKLEMHYMANSHGLGMTVFYFPKEKLIYISDLITPERVMFSIVPDFNIGGTVRAIKKIEALDFETVIFSHGRFKGDRTDVQQGREYIQDVQAAIKKEFEKGTNFMEIPAKIRLPKYEHWAMYNEWLSLNVWRIMLDMYMGPYPWRYEPSLQQPAFE